MLDQQPVGGGGTGDPMADTLGRRRYEIAGIAASLGGIGALCRVVGSLPWDFPIPVLVVQHIPRTRTSHLPSILGRRTRLRVKAAEDGERPVGGSIYVSQSNRHLVVRADGRLGLEESDPVNHCRPAADVTFRSLAEVHGKRAVAMVLTGRGRDGARGIEAVRVRGGATIAQDEATSEAFDMPCAAVEIGGADLVLPLDRMAFALDVLAGEVEEGEPRGAPLPRPAP